MSKFKTMMSATGRGVLSVLDALAEASERNEIAKRAEYRSTHKWTDEMSIVDGVFAALGALTADGFVQNPDGSYCNNRSTCSFHGPEAAHTGYFYDRSMDVNEEGE